jgi:excinuclease ABC subunit C
MSDEDKRKSLLEKARSLPLSPGVYVMKNTVGDDIYVGKAKELRRRVSSYFQAKDRLAKEAALVENIDDFEYVETGSELEALLLESRLIKDLQPKYNMMLKNNELYPFIEITWDEDFPRVFVTRQKKNNDSRYFGPFVAAGDLRAALAMLQRIFKFRICKRKIDASDKRRKYQRGCLNFHIGRCAGPCRDAISKEDYRKRISSLCRFLTGQKKDLLNDLREEMKTAADNLHFETAAALRDLVEALENLNDYPELDDTLAPAPPALEPERGLVALQKALELDWTPRRIEGIDIANLQGKETVGSLVYFIDGLPFKDGYRRFRIKTVEGQDDFRCVAEVVTRRYGGIIKRGEDMPDIVMIDGGKGQLHAAADALAQSGARVPVLLSLAKKEEAVFVWGREEPLALSKRNLGLRLLMHIRDEAHRFAQHYHHILRRKALFGEEDQSPVTS